MQFESCFIVLNARHNKLPKTKVIFYLAGITPWMTCKNCDKKSIVLNALDKTFFWGKQQDGLTVGPTAEKRKRRNESAEKLSGVIPYIHQALPFSVLGFLTVFNTSVLSFLRHVVAQSRLNKCHGPRQSIFKIDKQIS